MMLPAARSPSGAIMGPSWAVSGVGHGPAWGWLAGIHRTEHGQLTRDRAPDSLLRSIASADRPPD
jgi:hypothetical protein